MNLEYLETNNLILRKARQADLEKIWRNIWRDEQIAEMMLWKPTQDINDAKIRLNRTIEFQSENYAYFICLKTDDEPIGFAGVKEIKNGIYEETGICIAKRYQGKGYAKEVVCILKKLIFEELKGNKFIYGCFSTNKKSRKVCLSQGFKHLNSEETTREWDKKQFMVDYYYFDKDMYKQNNEKAD